MQQNVFLCALCVSAVNLCLSSADHFVLDRVRNQIRPDEMKLAEADFRRAEDVAVSDGRID